MIRYAILLAAGLSKRIGRPKQLINIRGHPLIWYPLAALHSLGVNEVCIVTRKQIAAELKQIAVNVFGDGAAHIVLNEKPDRENGYSLLLGIYECYLSDYTYVSMSDHIFSPLIATRLIEAPLSLSYVIAGDREPRFISVEEATKILSGGILGYAVGKDLRYWSHVDSGVHLINISQFLKVVEVAGLRAQYILRLNDITNALGKLNELGLASFSSLPWTEIDTPTDVVETREGRRHEVVEHVLSWLHS